MASGISPVSDYQTSPHIRLVRRGGEFAIFNPRAEELKRHIDPRRRDEMPVFDLRPLVCRRRWDCPVRGRNFDRYRGYLVSGVAVNPAQQGIEMLEQVAVFLVNAAVSFIDNN